MFGSHISRVTEGRGADGAAGINARAVTLTTPNQSFAYNSLGLVPTPATSVMTATAFNTTGEIYYEFFINDVSTGTATTTNTAFQHYVYYCCQRKLVIQNFSVQVI